LSDDVDLRANERVGTVLNEKWALERLLGIGGMAAVYEGRHRNGARAAVKVLHAELARHAQVRERFLREGYAANRVEHPGAVKVLDDEVIAQGPDAGTVYLVMELLEGESLQTRLERSPPMGERMFLAIAEQVLDVLESAHGRGVVHRDLKPENLFLVDESGAPGELRVKVLDFGLARLVQGQAITSYGLALGTPSFMSPEQAAGRIDEIDGRTDLFALAATGFRLRTGRRIHEGMNAVELVTKMANVAAPPIRALAPEVSEPFARVIDCALQFRREDRYGNAALMREDVRRAIAEIDRVDSPTLVAVPAVHAPPRPPPEPTIEVSGGDLERTVGAVSPSRARATADASTGLTHRRVAWLALVPLAFAGFGVAAWFGALGAGHPTKHAPLEPAAALPSSPVTLDPLVFSDASDPTAAPDSGSPVAAQPGLDDVDARDVDVESGRDAKDPGRSDLDVAGESPAGRSVAPPASDARAARPVPAVTPAPGMSTHRSSRPDAGPGIPHKLPATHHTRVQHSRRSLVFFAR
jgi:serine/threonine protein kinase